MFFGKKIILVILSLSSLSFGVDVPDLFMQGSGFDQNDPIVSTIVFHWYVSGEQGSDVMQCKGPWLPLEGRINWTGEVEWWKSQIKQIMAAGFDMIWVHNPAPMGGPQRWNLFEAMNQMRADGYDVPKVGCFLDARLQWRDGATVDLATEEGKDDFAFRFVQFYNEYYRTNTDKYSDSYLATIDGRVAIFIFALQKVGVNIPSLSRLDLEKRLREQYKWDHPIWKNGLHVTTRPSDETYGVPAISFIDEKISAFDNAVYYNPVTYNGIKTAHIKPGYWDRNIRTPGGFRARNGGSEYSTAWQSANNAGDVLRVYVESWNEYDEGSGIYACDEANSPWRIPSNTNTDDWSTANDPYEYIKTTSSGSSLFNGRPNLGSRILWHNLPKRLLPGETYPVKIVVQNAGNVVWSETGNFKFGQLSGTALASGGQTRWTVEDTQNEVNIYGGVFRGRPVVFSFDLVAPATEGIYSSEWGMVQEPGSGGFGETIIADIKVGYEITVIAEDIGNNTLRIRYTGEDPFGVNLKINLGEARICGSGAISNTDEYFNAFMDYAYNNSEHYDEFSGHPLADPNKAGLPRLSESGISEISLSLASIGVVGVSSTGIIADLHLTGDGQSHIKISTDDLRGGIIDANGNQMVTDGLPVTATMSLVPGGSLKCGQCGDNGFLKADFKGTSGKRDCYVNFEDYSILAMEWLSKSGILVSDITGAYNIPDGRVNMFDLMEFAINWLKCTDPSGSGCNN
jgi:hypothetical protein